jgi:hypothetical protein
VLPQHPANPSSWPLSLSMALHLVVHPG